MLPRTITPVPLALGAVLAFGACRGGGEDAAPVDSGVAGSNEPAAPGSTPNNPGGTIGAGGTVGTGPSGTSEPIGTSAIDTAGGTGGAVKATGGATKGTGGRPPRP